MSGFTALVEQLDSIIAKQEAKVSEALLKIEKLEDKIQDLDLSINDCQVEASQAHRIKNNIQSQFLS